MFPPPLTYVRREKPQILNHLAVSSRSCTNLVNALQHVNRERESVSSNSRVQTSLERVKTERKQLVRYIQLVQDEEMVGALIEANERIVIALQLYDKLSKPDNSESEDEGAGGAKGSQLVDAPGHRMTAEEKAAAEDAEIEAVRQRLADADFAPASGASGAAGAGGDDWEGEIEKLQFKQRRGIARHNSRRAEPGEAMKDLLDLDFDETQSSVSAGPSLRPQRGSGSAAATSSTAAGSGSGRGGGSLSDYSDYDSSEDEEPPRSSLAPPRSSAIAGTTHSGSSSVVRLDHGAELESWRQSHRPRIGEETSSLWSKEDEERWIRGEEDEDLNQEGEDDADPFGDEWEEVAGKLRASGAESGRREWAAV